MNGTPSTLPRTDVPQPAPGLGVPCREAQCDGVPCPYCDSDCTDCERAREAAEQLSTRKPRAFNA